MNVSIIIVNYNTVQLTLNCISSVIQQTKEIEYEIILVDNASTDESVSQVQNKYPSVNVIANTSNLGFGKANNVGAEYAKGEYIFLLNSDTILLNNVAKFFYDFIKQHYNEQIGALGCVMFDEQNSLNYTNSFNKFPTLKNTIADSFERLLHVKNRKLQQRIEELSKNGFISVDYITGADLFMKRSIFNELGGFDPRFFMYYEEVDLQYSMELMNLTRFIINGPRIIHFEGGATSKKMTAKKRRMIYESFFLYFKKHHSYISCFLLKSYLVLVTIFSSMCKKTFFDKDEQSLLRYLLLYKLDKNK